MQRHATKTFYQTSNILSLSFCHRLNLLTSPCIPNYCSMTVAIIIFFRDLPRIIKDSYSSCIARTVWDRSSSVTLWPTTLLSPRIWVHRAPGRIDLKWLVGFSDIGDAKQDVSLSCGLFWHAENFRHRYTLKMTQCSVSIDFTQLRSVWSHLLHVEPFSIIIW